MTFLNTVLTFSVDMFTNMTFINTVLNLERNWPAMVHLCYVVPLAMKECIGAQGYIYKATVAIEVSFSAYRTLSILV